MLTNRSTIVIDVDTEFSSTFCRHLIAQIFQLQLYSINLVVKKQVTAIMKWTINSRKPLSTAIALGLLLTCNTAFSDDFTVDVSNDDIAINADNASLIELLKEIEKLTGIPVKFVADTNERVTLNLGLTTIETAIGKITPNHMIVHESQNGKNVIKEVIIIPAVSDLANSGSGSAFLPSGNPAPDVTQTPETNDPNASTDTQPSGFNPQGVPETTGATPETITDEQAN